MRMGWQCSGLRWPDGAPVLAWCRSPGRDGGPSGRNSGPSGRNSGPSGRERRDSPLAYGRDLGFRAVGARRCAGARGNACPVAAPIAGRSTGGQCPECARLDRAHSVAADTVADDPRTYRVYLAWFGPGMVKVGITAEERGPARLLEQGAVAFSWLGRGPLMAARRTEELLRAALGVPDRIPYAAKRAVRSALPVRAERAVEIERLHAQAVALDGWPESLERVGFVGFDHVELFGLDGAGAAPATGVVTELADGGVVSGRLVAAAGPDLHLATADGGLVVLDTRLMRGWELVGADMNGAGPAGGGGAVTVPVRDVSGGGVQDGLF
ncbi:DUF2797 domain-containing protein [Streptomyces sp. NPDC088400]|uniref:DUF2797 domain-containing protein n=1 Tax=Streptomyces sp. NPDC088400 TaxID=3365861 RepID=UPI00382403D0